MAVGVSTFPASADTLSTLIRAISDGSSTLSGAHTSGVTTLTCASVGVAPTDGIAVITDGTNYECVTYAGKSGSTLTGVIRGADGTTARAWSSGVAIFFDAVPALKHNVLAAAIIATQGKIGVGASTPINNTVLTGTGAGTSAWVQPGMTFLGSGSLTSASTFDFVNVFSSDYTHYLALVWFNSITTSAELYARLGNGAVYDAGANNYNIRALMWGTAGGATSYGLASTVLYICPGAAGTTWQNLMVQAWIANPSDATQNTHVNWTGAGIRSGSDWFHFAGAGNRAAAKTFTDFRWLASSGSLNGAKGAIYGFRKA